MTIDQIKEISPEDMDFAEKMIDFLIEHVPFEFHLRKVMEECFELGEVVAKTLNKSVDNRPDPNRIAEEFGDLMLRMMMVYGVLFTKEGQDGVEVGLEKTMTAITVKLISLQNSLKEGKLYDMKM